MSLFLRPETPADFATIANIHIQAFGEQMDEAVIVALLRQRPDYDPDLALVAELDGQVVGHALFTPYRVRLLNTAMQAVCLAPIGIHPRFQKQGIGGTLIAEGHRIAQEKHYAFSFLLGHTNYYPRFGYHTHLFGNASLTVTPDATAELLDVKPVRESYLNALVDLWRREEANVDFALMPNLSLVDWLSPNPLVKAEVYLKHGAIVGYTRIQKGEMPQVRMFLARDAAVAKAMVATISPQNHPITLPLHPLSASAQALGLPKVEAWAAAMACPLVSGVLDEYISQLTSGKRPPGRVIWGTAFELA